jgi:hypothetical protein
MRLSESSTEREKRIKEREANFGKRKIWSELKNDRGIPIFGAWVYEGDPVFERLASEDPQAVINPPTF